MLDRATEFYSGMNELKKYAFLDRLKSRYGETTYDLLKHYYQDAKKIPQTYKKQILESIADFLSKAQILELYEMEVLREFQDKLQETRDLYEIERFFTDFIYFLKYIYRVKPIIPSWISESSINTIEIEHLFGVIRYCFIKEVELLCKEACEDLEFVSQNVKMIAKYAIDMRYKLTFFDLNIHFIYSEKVGKSEQKVIKKEIINIQKYSTQLEEEFKKNTLPFIFGIFVNELGDYLSKHILQTNYHQKSKEGTIRMVENDLVYAIDIYHHIKKSSRNIQLSSAFSLKAGDLLFTIVSSSTLSNIIGIGSLIIFVLIYIWFFSLFAK